MFYTTIQTRHGCLPVGSELNKKMQTHTRWVSMFYAILSSYRTVYLNHTHTKLLNDIRVYILYIQYML